MRSGEWLTITFLPLFTTFYLILLVAPGNNRELLWDFVVVLLFGYCCTSFAFVLNTWTDRKQDLRAQKQFAVMQWRRRSLVLLLAGLTAGCALALILLVTEPRLFATQLSPSGRRVGLSLWGSETLVEWSAGGGIEVSLSALSALLTLQPYLNGGTVLALAGLAYLASVAYSVPPVRLKERGWLGPVTIAVSEFALPQLLLFAVLDELSFVAGLIAALFGIAGLRMLLLHQILDHANDSAAGVDTLVVRKGLVWVGKLMFGVLLPLEISIGFAVLWSLEADAPGSLLAGLGSVLFFVFWSRLRTARATASFPVHLTAPFDFYWLLWPMFLLVRGLGESSIFLPLLVFHLLISHPVWSAYWEDLKQLRAGSHQ